MGKDFRSVEARGKIDVPEAPGLESGKPGEERNDYDRYEDNNTDEKVKCMVNSADDREIRRIRDCVGFGKNKEGVGQLEGKYGRAKEEGEKSVQVKHFEDDRGNECEGRKVE